MTCLSEAFNQRFRSKIDEIIKGLSLAENTKAGLITAILLTETKSIDSNIESQAKKLSPCKTPPNQKSISKR